jgi:hypothetical protein
MLPTRHSTFSLYFWDRDVTIARTQAFDTCPIYHRSGVSVAEGHPFHFYSSPQPTSFRSARNSSTKGLRISAVVMGFQHLNIYKIQYLDSRRFRIACGTSDGRQAYKWQNAVFLFSMQLDRRFNVRRHEISLVDTKYWVPAPLDR